MHRYLAILSHLHKDWNLTKSRNHACLYKLNHFGNSFENPLSLQELHILDDCNTLRFPVEMQNYHLQQNL